MAVAALAARAAGLFELDEYHHAPAAPAAMKVALMPAISGMLERRGGGSVEERTCVAPGWPMALIAATSGGRFCSIGDFHASIH